MNEKYNGMTYEQIEDDIEKELLQFGSHEIAAWERFKALYEYIPARYKLKILLNVVYSYYAFEPNELSEYIYDYLWGESLGNGQEHFAETKNKLQELNLIGNDGYVTLYRGYNEESEDNDIALSWTYSKDDALFFALRDNERYKDWKSEKRVTPYLIEIKVLPDYILFVIDDDREHEIILEPEAEKIIVSDEEVIMSQTEINEFFNKIKKHRQKELEKVKKEFKQRNNID